LLIVGEPSSPPLLDFLAELFVSAFLKLPASGYAAGGAGCSAF